MIPWLVVVFLTPAPQILRGGGREAGLNNGLVLLFECTEDLGLVRALLSSHSADIWSDTVRGVGCIDQFVRAADIQAAYCPPYWKYAVGEEGQWCTTLYRRGKALRIEAASRGEMVYNILEDVLDRCPTYDTFLRWYCHPSQSDAVAGLARHLELIRQLAPLQTHVDRQLFNSRVQCVLEVVCVTDLLPVATCLSPKPTHHTQPTFQSSSLADPSSRFWSQFSWSPEIPGKWASAGVAAQHFLHLSNLFWAVCNLPQKLTNNYEYLLLTNV